jgi:hypothetical protein
MKLAISMGYEILIFTMIFTTVTGYMLNGFGITSFQIIDPTIFLIGQGLLALAIAVANTPVVKGVAVAGWAAWLFVYLLNLNIPDPLGPIIFAVILVPSFISIGLIMLEIGKG